MRVIVCLDERQGMLFNHRRQSRDRALIDDVMASLGDALLRIAPYSQSLFAQWDGRISVSEDFLDSAANGDVCFVEDASLREYVDRIESVTIYRWNRHYPADLYFDLDLQECGFRLTERTDFAGTSHEMITKETYTK